MRRALSSIVPICCVFFLLPAVGHSEPVEVESIDWGVADSDRVIIGKVVKVESVKGDKGEVFEVATVAVSRSLRGPHTDHVTFLLHNFCGPLANKWRQAEVPVLFFLVQGQRVDAHWLPLAAKFDWCLRNDGSDQNAYPLTRKQVAGRRTLRVVTREYRFLSDPDEILKQVEETITALPQGRRSMRFFLEVPLYTELFKSLYDGSKVFLAVPVDKQLEAFGRRECKSEVSLERAEGARILRHFKNQTNIAILKSLLHDAGFCNTTIVDGQRRIRQRIYFVRQAAYDALQELGVTVDKPVLEEPLQERNDADGPKA